MIAWFVHGWAFGPEIWDRLAMLLPNLEPRFTDLGYSGRAQVAPPHEPAIWITHSFGTMHALTYMNEGCRALVAINGFDRFSACEGFAGVPIRVLDRMIARFAAEPGQVVSDFRRRCGMGAGMTSLEPNSLQRDLIALRDMDRRAEATALSVPVLCLHGWADPILPQEMRAAILPRASHATHRSAGHLLPIEQPAWCAERIADFRREARL